MLNLPKVYKTTRPVYSASSGFTLVELLITLTIISVLTLAGFTYFESSQDKARDSKRKTELALLQSAIEDYKADVGTYPEGSDIACGQPLSYTYHPGTTQEKTNVYLKSVPCDPLDPNNPQAFRTPSVIKSAYAALGTDPLPPDSAVVIREPLPPITNGEVRCIQEPCDTTNGGSIGGTFEGTGTTCQWCGSDCVFRSSNTVCPDVLPPDNAECRTSYQYGGMISCQVTGIQTPQPTPQPVVTRLIGV